jgi:hypothetical protein
LSGKAKIVTCAAGAAGRFAILAGVLMLVLVREGAAGFLGRLLKQLRRERKVAALHRSHDHGVEPLEPYRLVIRRDGIEILLRFLAGLEEQRFQFLV